MFSLKGRTVVVTGGGRGIGRGISRAMGEAGANVVIAGRTREFLESTAEEVEARGGKALVHVADITSFEGIQGLVTAAQDRFGYIHAWVNNAGSASPSDVGRMIDLDEGQWDRVVDLNLKWTFFAAQAAARAMTEGGSIINISSRSGSQPCPMTGQYGAAKAGVESLTATLAVEWGHMNIRVNAIAPGVVLTENSSSMTKESRRRRQIETVPLRRLGEVGDVAYLAVYFAADESAWVSGNVVQVTGGSRIPVGVLTYLHHVNREMEEKDAAAD
ncbi:MAG: SDR family oxidoreductase [Caulobacteraceae bacterium]|nr:SDR family oxidoreductase [Caulobacteraceae bacterium]